MTSQAAITSGNQPAWTEVILKGSRISPGLASGKLWVAGDILACGAEHYRIGLG